jgi:hypothetical protein
LLLAAWKNEDENESENEGEDENSNEGEDEIEIENVEERSSDDRAIAFSDPVRFWSWN